MRGLCNKFVSGYQTPSTYFIDKKDNSVRLSISNDCFLKKNHLQKLCTLSKKIELLFGIPQDIEFAINARGKSFILQARPITTLVTCRE